MVERSAAPYGVALLLPLDVPPLQTPAETSAPSQAASKSATPAYNKAATNPADFVRRYGLPTRFAP
jgi:hypothetical protein